jgi:hypothetical protein
MLAGWLLGWLVANRLFFSHRNSTRDFARSSRTEIIRRLSLVSSCRCWCCKYRADLLVIVDQTDKESSASVLCACFTQSFDVRVMVFVSHNKSGGTCGAKCKTALGGRGNRALLKTSQVVRVRSITVFRLRGPVWNGGKTKKRGERRRLG